MLVLVAVPLSIRLAAAAGCRGTFRSVPMLLALLFVPSALLTGALWITRQGTPEEGVVLGKSDIIDISRTGLAPSVAHRLMLSVASAPGVVPALSENSKTLLYERMRRAHADLEFDVDEKLYDEVRADSIVKLHAVHLGPLVFARLDAEPWWDMAPGRLQRLLPERGSAPLVSARAQITSVRTVSDAYVTSLFANGSGGVRTVLKQPYDEVRLEFTTPEGAQIAALDRVDVASAGALTPGMSIAILYPEDRPRTAKLTAVTRNFKGINERNYWGLDALAWSIAILVTISSYLLWQRSRSLVDRNACSRGAH
jgi:hypothetical protein